MAKTWVYNLKSQRYQDKKSGQFLSAGAVEKLTENYIAQQQDKLTALGDRLIAGEINTREWEDAFAKTLKEVLVNSYVLGRGGMAQMTSRDLGITSGIMREQYLYLRNFASEVMRGRMSIAQFQARQNLYIEKAYSVYWMGRLEAFKAAGYLYERDILTPGESCVDCVRIAARGWVRVGTNPAIGVDRACKNNCRCRKDFSKEMPTNSILNHTDGWIGGMPVVPKLPTNVANTVGLIVKQKYVCPLCDVEFPCGHHLPPTQEILSLAQSGDLSKEEIASIAPYIIRQDILDCLSVSPEYNFIQSDRNDRDNPYTMRSPSPEQLGKINKYRREGLPPFTAAEIVSIPMRASHNLMSHSNMAWAPASLADMALGMPGRPFLKDHEWEELDSAMGFIYEAELLHSMIAPAEFLEGEYAENNRQIINKQGFYQLILHVAVEATHPLIRDIELRRADGVSTGTLTKGVYICPLCDVEFPCGQHLPPSSWVMYLKRMGELTEEEEASIAPYIVRDGNYWSCEVSQVNVPNLQGTRVL